jgi:hypothetical protein
MFFLEFKLNGLNQSIRRKEEGKLIGNSGEAKALCHYKGG